MLSAAAARLDMLMQCRLEHVRAPSAQTGASLTFAYKLNYRLLGQGHLHTRVTVHT